VIKVCQWLTADQGFSPGTLTSSINITEILLKLVITPITCKIWVRVMVFNATFNNISVI
jgi:hypothetical protein